MSFRIWKGTFYNSISTNSVLLSYIFLYRWNKSKDLCKHFYSLFLIASVIALPSVIQNRKMKKYIMRNRENKKEEVKE